ncbi:YdcF family protein [Sphingomonas sp. UV9]|uniref:YdcF family protein n=1 Tax=Sphingomonas sp. UV9 TaxID=1851410 RepID=UPI000FFB6A25|nr:YdcF family protein [Sphingomonas sp. UV9]RXD07681.1 YdcF family protein [Sphingomonas sp. UV9]
MLAALAMTAAAPVWAETPAPVAVADTVVDTLSGRLFPMLGALGRSPAGTLDTRARAARIAACGDTPACVIEATIWTDQDRATIAAAVPRLAKTGVLRSMQPIADLSPSVGIDQELEALNVVLRVYGLGTPGRYPKIDGPIFATDSPFFADSVKVAIDTARAASDAPPATIAASVRLALALLDANDATAATRFEPLDQRENAGALRLAARTDWKAFRYSLLIVPGVGPEDVATTLSPRSKLHALLAAQRYRQGLAPFILVSGSAVHPRGTRFVEAVEIRRALIERYGIPADRVILEPYARHTTTNLRNATRRMVALGIPLDRPTLIVTDAEQSKYIESPTFTDRNRTELGYLPGTVGRRLSVYDLEFRPSRLSLRHDPRDPLDP